MLVAAVFFLVLHILVFTSVFIDGKVRSVLNPVCRNPYMKDQEPVQNDEYA